MSPSDPTAPPAPVNPWAVSFEPVSAGPNIDATVAIAPRTLVAGEDPNEGDESLTASEKSPTWESPLQTRILMGHPTAPEGIEVPRLAETEPPQITPSPDQEEAIQIVIEHVRLVRAGRGADPVITMVGNAGTGKTTVMRIIAQRVTGVVEWMAPTGKAAARLREILDEDDEEALGEVTTIHGRLYGAPVSVGECPHCQRSSKQMGVSYKEQLQENSGAAWECEHCQRNVPCTVDAAKTIRHQLLFEPRKNEDGEIAVCEVGSLLVCDEASMVDEDTHRDILAALPARATLMYVGDDGQLPPINGTWGADFANPTARLTKVHRQAEGSPIIQGAMLVRTQGSLSILKHMDKAHPWGSEARWTCNRKATLDDPAAWLAERRKKGVDATLITYTNRTRQALNTLVRAKTGATARATQTGLPLNPGDAVVVCANNHTSGHMNGEVFTVASATWVEHEALPEKYMLALHFKERSGEVWIRPDSVGESQSNYTYSKKFLWSPVFRWFNDQMAKHKRALTQHRLSQRRQGRGKALSEEELEAAESFLNAYPDPQEYLIAQRFDIQTILLLDYGECLTTHRSQGSQWSEVGFVWDRSLWGAYYKARQDWQRLVYTAITRAADKFALFLIKKGAS